MAYRLRSLGVSFTAHAVAESLSSDNVSTLAQRIAEQMTLLCPHVPAAELTSLSSRLAYSELANATGVTFDHMEAEDPVATEGNQIVWLPGSTAAIVLPAGEEVPRIAVVAAQAGEWCRRHGARLIGISTRGWAALRQVGSALVNAFEARVRVQ